MRSFFERRERTSIETQQRQGRIAFKNEEYAHAVFGQMPFLFTYAAANSWVQFFVIDRSFNMFQVSPRLNLVDWTQRIRCVLASINICRILYHYESMLPDGFLPMYMDIKRKHCRVTLRRLCT
uniref:AlNc14C9G1201 protein n=1 Tax=Albugo laibachii Nc14 TaxID=890382 RepID=F0W2F0_9STRA|nr:AlNc14C9G1201 [Albugo laibachii Nc14]|eukprot:CCA15236.1 AlNc14C9G1201 [Albugo laibachii Nc14]